MKNAGKGHFSNSDGYRFIPRTMTTMNAMMAASATTATQVGITIENAWNSTGVAAAAGVQGRNTVPIIVPAIKGFMVGECTNRRTIPAKIA